MRRFLAGAVFLLFLLSCLMTLPSYGEEPRAYEDDPLVRIKDITRIQGVRENQLMGFGLVVGLDGSGDSRRTGFTNKALSNMMRKFNINVSDADIHMRNVAAVMVTADLPTYASSGNRIDVTVSSMGDARSLEGGTLLQTPLEAANGEIYAVAQGALSVGGFDLGYSTVHVQRNHPTVGRISGGALVERTFRSEIDGEEMGTVSLLLQEPDFTTATRVAEAVDGHFETPVASVEGADRIILQIPDGAETAPFIAEVEQLPVRPDNRARVVINERTGTVVIGHNVRLSTVAVSHGDLTVRVERRYEVYYPPPFTEGEMAVIEREELDIEEAQEQLQMVRGPRVEDLIQGLNAVGASPRDIISILQALKSAGALHAELEIN